MSVEHGSQLELLYRDQGDRMWRAVLAFTGDAEVASDAVAEAFAQALARGAAIRDTERWIWRTIFRIAAGALKARTRHSTLGREEAYWMEEPARDLVVALRTLSDRQRSAVVLHHAAGYPAREIAEILGSTTAAVHVHLSRARRRLRELLRTDDA